MLVRRFISFTLPNASSLLAARLEVAPRRNGAGIRAEGRNLTSNNTMLPPEERQRIEEEERKRIAEELYRAEVRSKLQGEYGVPVLPLVAVGRC